MMAEDLLQRPPRNLCHLLVYDFRTPIHAGKHHRIFLLLFAVANGVGICSRKNYLRRG